LTKPVLPGGFPDGGASLLIDGAVLRIREVWDGAFTVKVVDTGCRGL
jgi:hypothetical protein